MITYFEKIFQLRAKSLELEPNATLSDVIGKKLKNFNDNWKKNFLNCQLYTTRLKYTETTSNVKIKRFL